MWNQSSSSKRENPFNPSASLCENSMLTIQWEGSTRDIPRGLLHRSASLPCLLCARTAEKWQEVHVTRVQWFLSPLLPAEVIIASKDQEKAQDSCKDDGVSREDECTSSPLDLRMQDRNAQLTDMKDTRRRKVIKVPVIRQPRSQTKTCNNDSDPTEHVMALPVDLAVLVDLWFL